jgi:hypothetical protein
MRTPWRDRHNKAVCRFEHLKEYVALRISSPVEARLGNWTGLFSATHSRASSWLYVNGASLREDVYPNTKLISMLCNNIKATLRVIPCVA